MLRTMFFALAALGLAVTSQAAVIITTESSPTVGVEGSTTYKLTATGDQGTKLIGFDFVGDGSLGFTGLMNQVVSPPAITNTTFNDSNPFFSFVGRDVSQDSQFSVSSTAGLAVNASESTQHLRGAFALSPANAALATNVWQFAQLSIPNAGQESIISYTGNFTVQGATGDPFLESVSGRVPGDGPIIPEPSTIALAGLALLGFVGYNRRK